jgi:hypothetical protein
MTHLEHYKKFYEAVQIVESLCEHNVELVMLDRLEELRFQLSEEECEQVLPFLKQIDPDTWED